MVKDAGGGAGTLFPENRPYHSPAFSSFPASLKKGQYTYKVTRLILLLLLLLLLDTTPEALPWQTAALVGQNFLPWRQVDPL